MIKQEIQIDQTGSHDDGGNGQGYRVVNICDSKPAAEIIARAERGELAIQYAHGRARESDPRNYKQENEISVKAENVFWWILGLFFATFLIVIAVVLLDIIINPVM